MVINHYTVSVLGKRPNVCYSAMCIWRKTNMSETQLSVMLNPWKDGRFWGFALT